MRDAHRAATACGWIGHRAESPFFHGGRPEGLSGYPPPSPRLLAERH